MLSPERTSAQIEQSLSCSIEHFTSLSFLPAGLCSRRFEGLPPGMLAIIGVELWLTRVDAIEAANAAFDGSLYGAIKSVELNVATRPADRLLARSGFAPLN